MAEPVWVVRRGLVRGAGDYLGNIDRPRGDSAWTAERRYAFDYDTAEDALYDAEEYGGRVVKVRKVTRPQCTCQRRLREVERRLAALEAAAFKARLRAGTRG